MTQINISTPFNFDDYVEFNSANGNGKGKVLDIVICKNQEIYYIINNDDGYTNIGIYPNEMKLILECEMSRQIENISDIHTKASELLPHPIGLAGRLLTTPRRSD